MAEVTVELPILGMTCAACVRRVEKAALAVPGVARADVNLMSSRARIALDPDRTSAGAAAAAIRASGYDIPEDAVEARSSTPAGERLRGIEQAHARETDGLARDAVIAIAAAVPLLAIAMAHGNLPAAFTGVPATIAQLALGTLVVLGPGMRYLRSGYRAARHGSPDMNTLVALGAGAAWLSSLVAAIAWLTGDRMHAPDLYFEAGAAIVAFVMVGKLLESRARARVADAVTRLMSLVPGVAHRLAEVDRGRAPADRDATEVDRAPAEVGEGRARADRDATEVDRAPAEVGEGRAPADRDATPGAAEADVDPAALEAGDRVVVRPGERVPADGTVVEGASALDESLLTGESLPVDKGVGAPIYAGTLNGHGALVVRVARAGGETAVARIARAVEDAQGDKAPIARLADRVSAYFVPAVLAIAIGTLAAWLLAGASAAIAVERAVAVLVIACPCALGLATPAAVAVGTARAAELGILFSGGGALERASSIDAVFLDKTGTLTAGTPALVAATADLAIVASVEQVSEHPIARAIVAGARARDLPLEFPTDATVTPGAGIAATLRGRRILIGTRDMLELEGISVPAAHGSARAIDGGVPAQGSARAIDEDSAAHGSARAIHDVPAGATVSHVAIDGVHAGIVAVADPPRPEAKAAVAELRASGIDVAMLTGDRPEAAAWIAGEVGIAADRVHAGVRPAHKAARIAEARAAGRTVAMVGDGINDAPALAAADVGIALGSGTDVAAATADVTLLRGGVANLPAALALARATLATIRRNLAAASLYNVVCIPVAAAGWLSPVLASAAMSLSSVSVLLSSLALRRWRSPASGTRHGPASVA